MSKRAFHLLLETSLIAGVSLVLVFALVGDTLASGFVLIHSNDRHGYVQARADLQTGKPVSGMDVEKTMIEHFRRQARAAGKRALLIDCGDFFQGTPIVNQTRGMAMIRLFNELRYDLVTFGNHEFDYGWSDLLLCMMESRFLWVSSTVEAPQLEAQYRPYATFDLEGTRVAFLGATTTTTPEKQIGQRIAGMKFHSPFTVLPPLVERLRRYHDVKIFVLLSHLGHNVDERLARQLPLFDIILGGHSHTATKRPVKVGRTWICQTGASSRFLGVLTVDVANGRVTQVRGRLHEVDRLLYGANAKVATIVDEYVHTIEEKLGAVVGAAETPIGKGLSGSLAPMAQLAANAFREAVDADVGLMNTGGVRRGLKAGEVTIKEVQMAVPYHNYVVTLEMTGTQLVTLVETAVNGPFSTIPADKVALLRSRGIVELDGLVPDRGGTGFLVGGGLRFVYDPRLPVGNRLLDMTIDGRPIDPHRVYRVATNDFLADGGDGFETFKEARSRKDSPLLDSDAVQAYIERRGAIAADTEASAVNISFAAVARMMKASSGEGVGDLRAVGR